MPSASVPLFGREYKITVGNIEVTALRVAFNVRRTIKPEPNTCDVKIWNLNASHRQSLEAMKVAPVKVEAGYKGHTTLLFLGNLRTALSERQGADIVTSLSSGDSGETLRTARINQAFRKGATTETVIRAIVSALGIPSGNINDALAKVKAAGLNSLFPRGAVLSGSAAREMTRVCVAAGLVWSVQNGKLQLLRLSDVLEGEAVKLNSHTGLVGSPTVDNRGILTVRTLLLPNLIPGRKIVLDAERLKGNYRAEACTYSGDSHGQDWYTTTEARRY